MTWTYSRHIHLSVRHPWGRVWVEARCLDGSVEWRIQSSAIGTLGEELSGPGWHTTATGTRAVAKDVMTDLAARLAAHIEKARGGA